MTPLTFTNVGVITEPLGYLEVFFTDHHCLSLNVQAIDDAQRLHAALGRFLARSARAVKEPALEAAVMAYLRSIVDPYEYFEGNAECCRFCFARRWAPHNDCIWQKSLAAEGAISSPASQKDENDDHTRPR